RDAVGLGDPGAGAGPRPFGVLLPFLDREPRPFRQVVAHCPIPFGRGSREGPPRPPAGGPRILRSSASPFDVWLFTVPSETPRASAVSRSESPSEWRRTTQARLRNGSRASARRTSPTAARVGRRDASPARTRDRPSPP